MQLANSIVAAGNYEADEIQALSKKLRGLIDALSKAADSRHVLLEDSFKFLQFTREADSIEAWIGDKEPQAASEDYGKVLLFYFIHFT